MIHWIVVFGALVATASWLSYRRRIAALRPPRLTDDAIRQIEMHGRIAVEEPLDLDEAAEEEERFWEESWDEPESY